jgi:hypothetical protein
MQDVAKGAALSIAVVGLILMTTDVCRWHAHSKHRCQKAFMPLWGPNCAGPAGWLPDPAATGKQHLQQPRPRMSLDSVRAQGVLRHNAHESCRTDVHARIVPSSKASAISNLIGRRVGPAPVPVNIPLTGRILMPMARQRTRTAGCATDRVPGPRADRWPNPVSRCLGAHPQQDDHSGRMPSAANPVGVIAMISNAATRVRPARGNQGSVAGAAFGRRLEQP